MVVLLIVERIHADAGGFAFSVAAGHEAPVGLAGRELRPGALQERRVEAERRGLGIERRGTLTHGGLVSGSVGKLFVSKPIFATRYG